MKSSINNREWLKVSQLSAGMQIAVPKNNAFAGYGVSVADESALEADAGDILWDEIEEIRELPEEQVWDIEVEGTHNFVAGHLIDKKTGKQLNEQEEQEWISGVDGGKAGLDASSKHKASTPPRRVEAACVDVYYGGIFAHNTYLDGSVGIGTANPGAKLSIFDETSDLRDAFTVATSTGSSIFRVDTAGDAFAQGAFNSGGADYAEHFYADTGDLVPGEVVCVSLENENAVARCIRPRDGNVMGIVSTNPAIIGNSGNIEQGSSVVVGMLGQVPAKVTNENGEIRPGDSLTSASSAGYAMKASAGDPTVGVALERLDGSEGMVRVLISRRNKSLTVAEVEEAVVDRIAAMEIEDEVALLVSDAVSGYNFDPVVSNIIGGELALLEEDFNLLLSDEINELRALIASQELQLIEELADLVAINTNLTVSGELEARDGLLVPLSEAAWTLLGGLDASSTPAAFRAASDGTVTAFFDFIISDGVTSTSVRDTLALLTADEMTKTELTVRQNMEVGNSFVVWGASAPSGSQIAGATVRRPVFKIAADGTVSVREDLVLSGYTQWNDIPGIVSVVVYNTASDLDDGAWVAGNRSASWYTEAIDAAAPSCDVAINDRCGTRSFPTQAIIAATQDSIYIFNSQDGSLWKKITSFEGQALSGITALHASDGALYIAQEGIVSILDFANDGIASVASTLLRNDSIISLHTERINGAAYLAVAGDQGVDLVNLDQETSTHFSGAVSNARLTQAGDLFTVASGTISVFTRAYNQNELIPSASYTASSTLSGLYVSQDGNTAYTASGSTIMSLRGGVLADAAISPQTEFDAGSPITSFHVDEKAHVIYAAYQGGVKALALGDGTELATYESGETSLGTAWTLSGEAQVASLTISGPVREGELLSDALVIATQNGLLAQAGDYSLRGSLASGLSGAGAPKEQSNRLTVTNEALFSGRVRVMDAEQLPVFAIDELTGNTVVREDIVFSSDASMQSMDNVSAVFVYDTTLDSDGGVAMAALPQKSVLAAAGRTVHIYNSRTKELWGTYASEGIASIHGLAAKDGTLVLYGDEGFVLVDLRSGTEGAVQSIEGGITAIAFDRDGELYYATDNSVYRANGGQSIHTSTAAITGIAFIKNNLYIANNDGITKVDLVTQETESIGEFSAITSIATASYNTLLVAYAGEVAEITESGDIINTWTNEDARRDRNNLPYLASSIASVSASDGAYAIALVAPSGDSFVWMQTREQSLADMLAAPRSIFTVLDRLQTPRIASVSSLSFTASSTISFTTGATSTPALVIRDSGDVDISGDVSISGNVGMGTTTVSSLKVTEGYLQTKPLEGAPDPLDCDSPDEYARMAFNAPAELLYLCGPSGWRSYTPNEAEQPSGSADSGSTGDSEPAPEEEPVAEEEPTATSTPEEL